jgi:hypothetical protein
VRFIRVSGGGFGSELEQKTDLDWFACICYAGEETNVSKNIDSAAVFCGTRGGTGTRGDRFAYQEKKTALNGCL